MLQASVEAWTQQVVQERLRFTEAVQLTTAQEKVEHWSSGVRNTALGTELYFAVWWTRFAELHLARTVRQYRTRIRFRQELEYDCTEIDP